MSYTGPTGNFGPEFYSGNADIIGIACMAQRWDGLRDGQYAIRFVGFPSCVGNDDVTVHVFKAIAHVMQTSPLLLDEYERTVAEDQGEYQGWWAAELWHLRFVKAVASVPLERVGQLTREWTQIIFKEHHEEDEEWFAPEVTQAVGNFVQLCKEASVKGYDVVEVWTLG